MNVLVSVTQDDIDHGKRGICERCPVARAVSRALGGRFTVSVTSNRILVYKLHQTEDACVVYQVTLGKELVLVHDFIVNFDTSGKVKPFSFELPGFPSDV